MSEDKLWYLKNLDIYEGISESELIQIAQKAYDTVCRRGNVIYRPDELAKNIYILKYGEVILYHEVEGKKVIFDTLAPGTVFGSFSVEDEPPTHFAETTKESLLCITPIEDFLKIIEKHPEMMLRFMQKMALKIQDYEHKIKMGSAPAKDRVYDELLRLRRKKKSHIFTGLFKVPLRVTHEDIASLTGLNRVTVTRAMKELKQEGVIIVDKDKGIIEVKEPAIT